MIVEWVVILPFVAAIIVFFGGRVASLIYIKIRQKMPISIESFVSESDRNRLDTECYLVRYSPQEHFKKVFRLLPWSAVGVFIIRANEFEFVGRKLSSLKEVKFSFPKDEARLSYIPKSFVRDGGLSWFAIELDGEEFYFASEQLPVLKDKKESMSTTGIYNLVSDLYINDEEVLKK